MKKTAHHLIAEVPRSSSKAEMTIGIDLGDVWSHYCTLNQDGEVVDRGRFRTTPASVDKWFTDLPRTRIAMEAGTHSIWISEQLQELGHEVLVANARELRAISHSDRKSDQADAEKLARFARMDPKVLRPISHRTIAQQEALTLIRARNLLVRLLDEQADLLHVNAGAPAMETRSRSVLARSSNSRIVVCAFGSLSGMSQI
jgi:transposase